MRYFIAASLAVILLLLGACGQKGDLYLPAIPEAPNVLPDRQVSMTENVGKRDQASESAVEAETEQDQQDEQSDNP